MADERQNNWDWVNAIGQCNAEAVFGELMALARRDMGRRNQQLGRDRFEFVEPTGIEFGIRPAGPGGLHSGIYVKLVEPDLREIRVERYDGSEIARYTVGLDDEGRCRLVRDGQKFAHWQVLRASFEGLLF